MLTSQKAIDQRLEVRRCQRFLALIQRRFKRVYDLRRTEEHYHYLMLKQSMAIAKLRELGFTYKGVVNRRSDKVLLEEHV